MKGDRWVNSCTVHEHEHEHEGCMCVHDPKLGFNGYMYICLHVLHAISIPPPYTLIAFMFAHTKPHLGEIPHVQPYFPTCQHVHMATLRNKRLEDWSHFILSRLPVMLMWGYQKSRTFTSCEWQCDTSPSRATQTLKRNPSPHHYTSNTHQQHISA